MTIDGIFFSLMVGMGETYLPAFALAVGLGETTAGLITSIPLLVGAVLQMLSPRAVRWLGSHRRWVVLCVAVQALSFAPLCAAAYVGQISHAAMFFVASIYWGFGMAAGPAWNTWVETLVPRRVRSHYFAKRTKFLQAGTMLGFIAGGVLLQYAKAHDRVLLAFAALFAVAGLCRIWSARCLMRQSEPQPLSDDHREVPLTELWRRIKAGGSERLLVFLVAFQFCVYISGPYFNPFILEHLKVNYVTFVLLVATSFAGKAAALPFLGRLAHAWGARRLLVAGACGIVPLAGLWLVSNWLPYLVTLQFVGGMTWAAYELAMMLLFFEMIPRAERTSVLTMYNVGNALAMVLGSLCGWFLLTWLGEVTSTYLLLFALSSTARLCTVAGLLLLPAFWLARSARRAALAASVERVDLLPGVRIDPPAPVGMAVPVAVPAVLAPAAPMLAVPVPVVAAVGTVVSVDLPAVDPPIPASHAQAS